MRLTHRYVTSVFEEPSFWLAHSAMGIHSAINIQITKQIGGGAQWVSYHINL